MHLNQRRRIRMGKAVLRHFKGELQRNGTGCSTQTGGNYGFTYRLIAFVNFLFIFDLFYVIQAHLAYLI